MGLITPGAPYVRNYGGTPGILEDTLANRPTLELPGTLFVATDTKLLYRFNGSTWDEIAGGAGSSQNWQETLIIGSVLNQDNTIIPDVTATRSLAFGTSPLEFYNITFVPNNELIINSGNGIQAMAGGEINLAVRGGNRAVMQDNFGALIQAGTLGGININSGSAADLTIEGGIGGAANVFVSNATTGGLLQFDASGSAELSNVSDLTVESNNGNLELRAANGQVAIESLGALGITSDSSEVVIAALTGIILQDQTSASTGIDFPIGSVISFPTATAPGTSTIALPTSVFGGSTSLLGTPADWIAATVNGIARKIPVY